MILHFKSKSQQGYFSWPSIFQVIPLILHLIWRHRHVFQGRKSNHVVAFPPHDASYHHYHHHHQ